MSEKERKRRCEKGEKRIGERVGEGGDDGLKYQEKLCDVRKIDGSFFQATAGRR